MLGHFSGKFLVPAPHSEISWPKRELAFSPYLSPELSRTLKSVKCHQNGKHFRNTLSSFFFFFACSVSSYFDWRKSGKPQWGLAQKSCESVKRTNFFGFHLQEVTGFHIKLCIWGGIRNSFVWYLFADVLFLPSWMKRLYPHRPTYWKEGGR